jgi:hypothetical protein
MTRGTTMDTAGPDQQAPEAPPFRLGLIGAGRMGRTHLDALQSGGAVTVAGVAEPQPALRAALADAGIPAFASTPELLAAGNIDGALIAAPTDRHVDLVHEVMDAGVPVLCEKPCGLTAQQAAQCGSGALRPGGSPRRGRGGARPRPAPRAWSCRSPTGGGSSRPWSRSGSRSSAASWARSSR